MPLSKVYGIPTYRASYAATSSDAIVDCARRFRSYDPGARPICRIAVSGVLAPSRAGEGAVARRWGAEWSSAMLLGGVGTMPPLLHASANFSPS
jgi:hypothetical protein